MKPFRLWLYGLVVRLLPETRAFALKAAVLRWCGAIVGRNVRINSSASFLGIGDWLSETMSGLVRDAIFRRSGMPRSRLGSMLT